MVLDCFTSEFIAFSFRHFKPPIQSCLIEKLSQDLYLKILLHVNNIDLNFI
nr:MAG TPA: hypothetical protein [Caudoviricetes sp.]